MFQSNSSNEKGSKSLFLLLKTQLNSIIVEKIQLNSVKVYRNQLGDNLSTLQHTIITYIDNMSEDLLEKENT
jgi:hypothetical protein